MERLPPDHVFAGLVRNNYRCLLIDPPTRFIAGTKGRPQHYARMTDANIAALPVADLLHPDGAFIFLWVTSPKLYRNGNSKTVLRPDEVASAWAARWCGRAFEWIKLNKSAFDDKAKLHTIDDIIDGGLFHVGMGYTTRKNAEDVLLFKTGSPERLAKDVRELVIAPIREHSRKPDEVVKRIERFCPGPRVELFAREARDGWDTWGDQVGMFNGKTLTAADAIYQFATGPTGPTGEALRLLQVTGVGFCVVPDKVRVDYGPTGPALFEYPLG